MCHRSGLPRTGLSRTSRAARALALLGALLFHSAHAGAQPRTRAVEAGRHSAVELAAGACRLERWAAAIDLMRVVERQARHAEDWLCLARAQLHTRQWVAALDSYDELAESEAPAVKERVPARDRLAKQVEARQLGAVERQELEERLGWIQIVPSVPLPASVTLSLDGEPIARSRIGVAFPVQPGPHAFAVEVHGVVRELDHWRVAQGERRRVKLSLPAEPSARQAVAPPGAVRRRLHPQVEQYRAPPSELARWARGALYAGGIGTGLGFALLAANGATGEPDEGVVRAGIGSLLLGGVALMTGAGLHLA
ncbi:MAG: hypothetical protein ABI895_26565, partial [Deltaproteobacteria bacterium]